MNIAKISAHVAFQIALAATLLWSSILAIAAPALKREITPIIREKISAGLGVTVLFLGDSNTAGCGTSDISGAKTFPGIIASHLVAQSQLNPSIGVIRFDKEAFVGQPVDKELCRAYKENVVTLRQSLLENHRIIRDGVGGNSTHDLLARLENSIDWLTSKSIQRVDLVVIMVGINDSIVQRGTRPTTFSRNLRLLIGNLKKATNSNGQTLFKEILLVSSFSNGSLVPASSDGEGHPFQVIRDELSCKTAMEKKVGYPNTVCDLDFYNHRMKVIGNRIGSNVYFLDVAGQLLRDLGVNNNKADYVAQKNIRRWLANADVYHPNDYGYQAIADQIFYNVLSPDEMNPAPAMTTAAIRSNGGQRELWIKGTSLSTSLRAFLSDSSGRTLGAYLIPTVSGDTRSVTFALPNDMIPDCKAGEICKVTVMLKDMRHRSSWFLGAKSVSQQLEKNQTIEVRISPALGRS
ncbi:SGNH/GDSL hydrolase family protein [Undibacterium terreum]|uniref:SGNH/GDSL hydrolase family protein n=1 Tax=Undibacterium terreum TaxID=1224302 RepID=UPI00166E29BB|nr:SGNH/GDSL hydrolase family protein [Undibacterium terreum]